MDLAPREKILRAGQLEIRPAESAALVGGRPLKLTVRELQLLIALAERAGQIVSRGELYSVVWPGPFRSYDRSVDVYVSKLRAKLDRALPEWRYIHTHFGFGYRFAPEPAPTDAFVGEDSNGDKPAGQSAPLPNS